MTEPETTITFETETEYSNGYEMFHIRIRQAWVHDVKLYISKVVEPGYYGEPEVGERVQGHLKALDSDGVETYYESYSGHTSLHLRFQLFERNDEGTKWCRTVFEHLGMEFDQIERAMKLLRSLGKLVERARARAKSKKQRDYRVTPGHIRNASFESPEDLLEALRRAKAVEVRTVKFGEYSTYKVAA